MTRLPKLKISWRRGKQYIPPRFTRGRHNEDFPVHSQFRRIASQSWSLWLIARIQDWHSGDWRPLGASISRAISKGSSHGLHGITFLAIILPNLAIILPNLAITFLAIILPNLAITFLAINPSLQTNSLATNYSFLLTKLDFVVKYVTKMDVTSLSTRCRPSKGRRCIPDGVIWVHVETYLNVDFSS